MTSPAADAAFTAFVDAEYPYLSRAAYLMTSDRWVAEDLLQEALVRTYQAWSRIDPGSARAYCRRTMVNLTTDRWRRRRFEAPNIADPDLMPDSGWGAEYGAVDDRDAIVRELAALSARERAVLMLRFYADLSEQDVAAELGISLGTVKSTCHRALKRLRSVAGPTPLGA